MKNHKEIIKQIEQRFQAKKYEEAMDLCNLAIAMAPADPIAYRAKARLCQIKGQFQEAERYYRSALKRMKPEADDLVNLGIVVASQQRYDDAIGEFNRVLEINPTYLHAVIQRGAANWEMHRYEDALADFRRANEISPNDPNANWILGLLSLQMNDFKTGWPLYEKRWLSERFKSRKLVTEKPQWFSGSPSKSVLVWGEQGIGDQIIYGSLLPAIRKQADYVTAMLDSRLIPLFKRSMPDINFMSNLDQVEAALHETQIPFASIGSTFIQELDDIPAHAARRYLKADPELVEKSRQELKLDPNKLTVGISWISTAIKIGPHKSVNLEQLMPILKGDYNILNLQYGSDKRAMDEFNRTHGTNVVTASVDLWGDFEGLAALCEQCDVVISISSSTVHLAGALGVPVLLMDANKLWYWGNTKEGRSLWYPSVQIFPRSNMVAPWDNVIERVVEVLGSFSNGG